MVKCWGFGGKNASCPLVPAFHPYLYYMPLAPGISPPAIHFRAKPLAKPQIKANPFYNEPIYNEPISAPSPKTAALLEQYAGEDQIAEYYRQIQKTQEENLKATVRDLSVRFSTTVIEQRKKIAETAILDAFISPEDDPEKLRKWIEGLMYVKPELAAGILKAMLLRVPAENTNSAANGEKLAPLIINNINQFTPSSPSEEILEIEQITPLI